MNYYQCEEFGYPNIGGNSTEDSIFEKIIEDDIQFELENSSNQIGSIRRCLTREKILRYFWALGVARDGHEQIRLSESSNDRHRVSIILLHAAWRANGRRRRNDSTSWWASNVIRIRQVILEATVAISTYFGLVHAMIVQSVLLDLHGGVNGELLEQLASA